jgi:hypothetical protein
MQQGGSAHLGVQEFAAATVSLAQDTDRRLQVMEPDLLGHVYRPNAGAGPQVENASFSVLRDRRLVQHVSPRYGEQLVIDVHAILLWLAGGSAQDSRQSEFARAVAPAYLVARILVHASPVAMVVAAVFQVIAVMSGHGQSAATVSCLLSSTWPTTPGAAERAAQAPMRDRRSHGAGRSSEEQCTHPFDAIVTIGTMLSSKQASRAGSVD